MIKDKDNVLVCVSGGPDSVAMFYILKDLGYKIKTCHYNHKLRGKESEKDEVFVKNICRLYNINCLVRKNKTKTLKYSEDTLREKRYNFFLKTAKKQNCNTVATGHTFDDQVETVFLRLIRGTGISGLAGIPPVRQESGIRIVRPLIEIKRKQVIDFLTSNKYEYRIDKTNLESNFLRNKVRNIILPFIEKQVKTDIKKNIFYLSCIARNENNFIDTVAKKLLRRISPQGVKIPTLRMDLKKLRKINPAILGRIIRIIFKEKFQLTLNFEDMERIIFLIYNGGPKLNLCSNTFVSIQKNYLIIK